MMLKLAHRWWKRPMLSLYAFVGSTLSLSFDVRSSLTMLVVLGSSILGRR